MCSSDIEALHQADSSEFKIQTFKGYMSFLLPVASASCRALWRALYRSSFRFIFTSREEALAR